ncbi:MAG: alpha-ketoacid dehydrogenase subunit beta [Rhizobiaceae bacterium]|nr:alpha-ketoacid dehydrogenase subunit beta [Rhizobiaceae bacterium]
MARLRMIQAINSALREEMARDPKVILFGEDVRMSLFGDTKGLFEEFGPDRVRDTPISEVLLTGMAVGAAAAGYRVVLHLMYANFLYTGFDAIANQAAKLRYMTGGQIKLPIVFMASCGGGRSSAAQHSDSPHPMFMNLGGVHVATPGTPADAKGMLKSAIRDDNPTIYLTAGGRGGSAGDVPDEDVTTPIGVSFCAREGTDITVVPIGSMVRPTLTVAERLAKEGISVEVIDPRWMVPLDTSLILKSLTKTGRLVVVDEARDLCSAASQIAAVAADQGFSDLKAPVRRLTVPDLAIPYSPPLERAVLPDAEKIEASIRELVSYKAG